MGLIKKSTSFLYTSGSTSIQSFTLDQSTILDYVTGKTFVSNVKINYSGVANLYFKYSYNPGGGYSEPKLQVLKNNKVIASGICIKGTDVFMSLDVPVTRGDVLSIRGLAGTDTGMYSHWLYPKTLELRFGAKTSKVTWEV